MAAASARWGDSAIHPGFVFVVRNRAQCPLPRSVLLESSNSCHYNYKFGSGEPADDLLNAGVFLKVRINDPMGLLPQSVDGAFGARLSIGAFLAMVLG
jgi:hypothetical protein